MYLLQNAIKNIGRNKGRNILASIIIFALILTAAVCTIIGSTTQSISDSYKKEFGAEVILTPDVDVIERMKNENRTSELRDLTVAQLMDYADSPLIQSSEYTGKIPFALDNAEAVGEADMDSGTFGVAAPPGQESATAQNPTVVLLVSSRSDISEEFKSGKRVITQGEMFSTPEECIISHALAELNGLTVGDAIQFKSMLEGQEKVYTLTISGIYENPVGNGDQRYQFPIYNPENEIYADFDALRAMNEFEASGSLDMNLYLFTRDDLDTYEKELRDKGLPEYFALELDQAEYEKAVAPIEGLSRIANVFMTVILAVGAVVLLILSAMTIRERKYEIGVLRAMGMKKGKVAVTFMLEMLFLTGLCLVLALGSSAAASQPVADLVLEIQVRNLGAQADNAFTMGGNLGNTGLKPIEAVDIQFSTGAIARIVLIALGLAGISNLLSLLYIMRFEPMKILSERN